jgi:hypothetical protein
VDTTSTSGNASGYLGTFSTSGSGFTGTAYIDHVNIGGSGQTPAPLYGWGVSLPSFLGLRPLEQVVSSKVTFSQSNPAPDSSYVLMRVSTDGGTTWGNWLQCTNGSPIPGLVTGINGQSLAFQFDVKLYGSSTSSPSVSEIQVTVSTELTLLAPLS